MTWWRKSLVYLLSLVLLISLVGLAVSTGTNVTLSKPAKVEKMLADSGLYNSFALFAAEQVQKTAGHDETAGTIQPQNLVFKQAAADIFSPRFLQQSTNKV